MDIGHRLGGDPHSSGHGCDCVVCNCLGDPHSSGHGCDCVVCNCLQIPTQLEIHCSGKAFKFQNAFETPLSLIAIQQNK